MAMVPRVPKADCGSVIVTYPPLPPFLLVTGLTTRRVDDRGGPARTRIGHGPRSVFAFAQVSAGRNYGGPCRIHIPPPGILGQGLTRVSAGQTLFRAFGGR